MSQKKVPCYLTSERFVRLPDSKELAGLTIKRIAAVCLSGRFYMKNLIFAGFFLFLFALPCAAQTQETLCPKHIETPTYLPLARIAHISGIVALAVTIDADGKVSDVKVTNENDRGVKLLKIDAVHNIRLWTFRKPQSAPVTLMVTYDFQLDDKLPLEGVHNYPAVIVVTYDLPDRVTIRGNGVVVMPDTQ
jgi:TonB family protein